MIIGNGLLAKSLQNVHHHGITLFCSGVSDSSEIKEDAFERERNLLLKQSKENLLVYFSSTSIFNPYKKDSKYINHKIELENLIAANFKSYLILRLPNVIGSTGNDKTLFPFFYHSLQGNRSVEIQEGARRQLLSARDLPHIVESLIKHDMNGTMNVCFSEAPTVLEIYLLMCEVLDKKPCYTLAKGEPVFEVDNSAFQSFIQENDISSISSWQETIRHYTLLLSQTGNLDQGIRP